MQQAVHSPSHSLRVRGSRKEKSNTQRGQVCVSATLLPPKMGAQEGAGEGGSGLWQSQTGEGAAWSLYPHYPAWLPLAECGIQQEAPGAEQGAHQPFPCRQLPQPSGFLPECCINLLSPLRPMLLKKFVSCIFLDHPILMSVKVTVIHKCQQYCIKITLSNRYCITRRFGTKTGMCVPLVPHCN